MHTTLPDCFYCLAWSRMAQPCIMWKTHYCLQKGGTAAPPCPTWIMRCTVECIPDVNLVFPMNPLSSSVYPMITYTHPIAGNLPKLKWLLGNYCHGLETKHYNCLNTVMVYQGSPKGTPRGRHTVTYGFQLSSVLHQNNQTYDTCTQASPEIYQESQEISSFRISLRTTL